LFKDYLPQFPNLKCTTVCERKSTVCEEQQNDTHNLVTDLHGKKRGNPSTFPEEVITCIRKHIHAMRDACGMINTAIAIEVLFGARVLTYWSAMENMPHYQ